MKRSISPLAFALALGFFTTAAAAGDSEDTLKIALVSPECVFGDIDANLATFSRYAERAKEKGARLVCFPELALVSYSVHPDVLRHAQPIPGPATKKLEALAKRLDVYLSVGMAEREGDRHYVAQVLVGPGGFLGKYRKARPTNGERQCGFSAGEEFPTWDVDGFRLGFLICADGRTQTTIDEMKSRHVDVIHHPHGNWVAETLGHEAEDWTRSKTVYFAPRAIHARAHILINNSAGDTAQPHEVIPFSSGALAIDPLGQVIDRTDTPDRKEKMIVVELKKPEDLIPPGELRLLKKQDEIFAKRFGR